MDNEFEKNRTESENDTKENLSEETAKNNNEPLSVQNEEKKPPEYTPRAVPSQGAYHPPVYNPYTPVNQPQFSPASYKKEKEKKPVTVGVVVAIALICAVLSSAVTSAFFITAGNINNSDDSNGSTVTDVRNDSSNQQTLNINAGSEASIGEAVSAKCLSSVVGIRVTSEQTYWSWFGTQTGESYGEGTGVIYSSDGYIITNYHVISEMVTSQNARMEVFFPGDVENGVEAKLVGYVVSADIAVIKIDKTGLTPIELGNSDSLVVGQTVVAIGNPGGIEYIGSVSQGIISGLNRTISIENIGKMTVIQTDAAINPGNSGGALLNSEGKLVGIVSSKIVSEQYEGIGFAIPVNTTAEIVKNIIENPDSGKPYIGVTISAKYDSQTLNKMGYPSGVVVESVSEDGPAESVGIKRGDIITKVNGADVTSYDEFITLLNMHKPGMSVTLTVYRDGRNYNVDVTLGD